MGYNDDMTRPRDWWQEDMDPSEEARIMAAVRARAAARRRRELAEALLIAAAGFGGAVALVYFWRMS